MEIKRLLKKIYHKVFLEKTRKNIRRVICDLSQLHTMSYLNSMQKISFFKHFFSGDYYEEYSVHGGKQYTDRTFFIIRRQGGAFLGLFSLYITNAGWIKYAVDKGYIPVVDMCNYENNYITRKQIGKINAWELYFDQPMGYGIKEAYRGKNVIISNAYTPENRPNESTDLLMNQAINENIWKRVACSYMKIRKMISDEIDEQYRSLFTEEGTRVLGISLRGTDYVRLRPKSHPVQPDVELVIRDAENKLVEWKCDKIYIATEDKGILEKIKKHFGSNIYDYQRDYVDYKDGSVCNLKEANISDAYKTGKEYLESMVILTRCNCIIAGRTSGLAAIATMDNRWDHMLFYDLGVY